MRLCESQAKLGADVELHVVRSAGQQPELYSIKEHGSIALSGKFLASPSLKKVLSSTSPQPRVVHNHSLWMMPNIYPGRLPRPNILVTSPRGTLSDWAWNRSYWIKQIAWQIGQKRMLERCDCFHATAEHEFHDIRKRGFRQPVAIIPNGVDVPAIPSTSAPRHDSQFRILLYLARLHPVKGIENLIRSWSSVSPRFQDWKLLIAGDGDATYERKLRELTEELRVERLEFVGPMYGAEKNALLSGAELYVLPSFSENFGVSIAESMACGTPVITTDQTPWTTLDVRQTGWCIGVGERQLTECLEKALNSEPAALTTMGNAGRKWMIEDYSWDEIARKTLQTYSWLRGNAGRPTWIREES